MRCRRRSSGRHQLDIRCAPLHSTSPLPAGSARVFVAIASDVRHNRSVDYTGWQIAVMWGPMNITCITADSCMTASRECNPQLVYVLALNGADSLHC